MSTKQRILTEALALFAKKGYNAVYVGDIAEAVGIKAPSLYKHYKSKQAIFDSCIELFSLRMDEIKKTLLMPDTPNDEITYQTASMENIIDIATALFMFFLQDEVASKLRKIVTMERYHNPQLNKLFEDLFINGVVEYEEKLFSELMDAGIIKKDNPHTIALRFYTPIFYLLQKYDMMPDNTTDAKNELVAMVKEFCITYCGYDNGKNN